MSIHIYRVNLQPATHYIDNNFDPPMEFKLKPNSKIYCENCHKKHYAKNMNVAVYYDRYYYYPAPGKGCMNPILLKKIDLKKFKNRSRGQINRWKKIRELSGKTR